MLRWLVRRAAADGLPFGVEYVPGLGTVAVLGDTTRWRLAGEYATTHRLIGPWYRRSCVRCETKGGCEFGRWAAGVLIARAERDWLGP
jgi:hypothetical protein